MLNNVTHLWEPEARNNQNDSDDKEDHVVLPADCGKRLCSGRCSPDGREVEPEE